jgi:CHRD domain
MVGLVATGNGSKSSVPADFLVRLRSPPIRRGLSGVPTGMRRPFPLVAAALAAIVLFVAGLALAGGSSTVRLSAVLDAGQETSAPKGAVHATGRFTATLQGRALTWRLTFSRLSGKALAAHIHLGRAGVAGPVAVPLCGPCVSGVHARVVVTPRVRAALVSAGAYVNVHTAKNPAGEIRGQVAGPRGVMPASTTTAPTTTGGGYRY